MTNDLLGYPPDARLLIINADDFGLCHAVNVAIFRTLTEGVVRSATVMMPCPWALHAVHLLQERPDLDFGVHLTAICDTKHYKFGPLTPKEQVSSLVNEAGHFYSFERMGELLACAKIDELETEFRAQIEAALATRLSPSHLDWHAIRFGQRTDMVDLMIGLAKEYGLALRVIGQPTIEKVQRQRLPTIDYDFFDSFSLPLADKPARFIRLLRELPAGLSEWAVHPGLDTDELRTINAVGAPIRQSDFDFLMSQTARDVIEEEGVILLDYRPLQAGWRTN